MAECSTSIAANSTHDVFISHRGPEVKKTFANHLYRRLLSCGLRGFLDQPELQAGEPFPRQIENAIGSASVHVAIFSPGYADSRWCLDELVQMLDTKKPIIPVFYNVKPAELRWTRGKKTRYAEALETLEKKTDYDPQIGTEYDPQTGKRKLRYDSSVIEKWRTALSNVADITGFELEACNGDEGELVEKVVERVLKKVKKPALALDVAKYPTGLDDKVKDFETRVLLPQQQRGKPQIFGIAGLGGVGKTTLAKELFNRKNSDYSSSCFLFDVRDNAGKGTLSLLQKILLKSLTGLDHPINSVAEGKGMIKKHLSSSKVLVVIDDVDQEDQVDALLPHQTSIHSDSLILITSRDRHVLQYVIRAVFYLQAPLQLRELRIDAPFSSIPKSIGRLKHLERIVIGPIDKAASLVPLTELSEGFCLLQSLKALVLESCSKIKSLPECFGKLTNLHHIQLLGWSALESLPESFGNLTNLQQMQLVRCGALQRLAESFGNLSNLQQIELSECSALERLPESFGSLTNLQRIQLVQCGSLQRLPESFGNSSNLQHIDLSECSALERLPDSLGKLTKLQYLDLKGCSNLNMSSETLGDICTLEYINLTGCGKIEVLPTQVAHQRSLEQLHLKGTNLRELPSAIGELSDLEVLVVGGALLETLPRSLCGLNNLKELQLYECRKLKCLPSSLGDLKNLKELRVEFCNALNCLPASLGDLNNLKELRIWCCPELKCLPVSIGRLAQLTDLYIYDSPWIRELLSTEEVVKGESEILNDLNSSILPRLQLLSLAYIGISEVSFAQGVCSNLQSLRITSCDNVAEVGTLPNTLIYLTLLTCYSLRRVGKICSLAQLQYLDIRGCIELEELPGMEALVSLGQLRAGGCVKLKRIRGLGQMTKLHYLAVDRCPELEELEGIHDCMSLAEVCLGETPKLQWGAGELEQLRQRCSVWEFDHVL